MPLENGLWRALFCQKEPDFLLPGRRLTDVQIRTGPMKIKNSLKSLKSRHRANRLVRRKGRVYIINKQNPRFKARQG